MSNRLYDILNKIQRWIPALAVFYVTLSKVWGLPLANEISETITAVAVLLATTLEIATSQYLKKGGQENDQQFGQGIH